MNNELFEKIVNLYEKVDEFLKEKFLPALFIVGSLVGLFYAVVGVLVKTLTA